MKMADLDSVRAGAANAHARQSPAPAGNPEKVKPQAAAADTRGAGGTGDVAGKRADGGEMLTVVDQPEDMFGNAMPASFFSDLPELTLPSKITPEQLEAMVGAILSDAMAKTIAVTKNLVKLSDTQRLEFNHLAQIAADKAKAALKEVEAFAKSESVTKWIKSVGATVAAFVGAAITTIATGGVAAAFAIAGFLCVLADLVNTGVQHFNVMVKAVDGSMQKLDVSLGGLVTRVVQQIAQDHPDFYSSEEEKNRVIRDWSIGLTVSVTLTCLIGSVAGGAVSASSKLTEGAVKVVEHTTNYMSIAGKAVAAGAELGAGGAAVYESTSKMKLAGLNADSERARAERRFIQAMLEGVRTELRSHIDAFSRAIQARDASIDNTSQSIAAAHRTSSSIIRNIN
jgi:hypothetical protein